MMTKSRGLQGILFLLCTWLVGHPGSAVFCQAQSSAQRAPSSVAFGVAVGMPGQEARLPIYISGEADAQIFRVALEVEFPSPPLTFLHIEPGFLARDAQVQVEAQQAGSVVQVDLTAPEDPKGEVPQGLIAFLLFRIAEDAKDARLQVLARKISMTDSLGQPLSVLEQSDGLINVMTEETTPMFACFFYMH